MEISPSRGGKIGSILKIEIVRELGNFWTTADFEYLFHYILDPPRFVPNTIEMSRLGVGGNIHSTWKIEVSVEIILFWIANYPDIPLDWYPTGLDLKTGNFTYV